MDIGKQIKISVIMPVYNCEAYIKDAVDSILNQTFQNFELIIIDDASTDATVSIIKKYKDQRIQLKEKPKNSGYTTSLNYGLSIAKGEYIARMDGDDISLPERFLKQISFLDNNQDVILCGSLLSIIGTDEIIALPEYHEDIKLGLLKGNCIAHPSVMFRNLKWEENSISYNTTKEPAEDYDLWSRLLGIGKLHNLQEVLINYRVHNAQVSKKKETQQTNVALETRLNIFEYLDCNIELRERRLLKKVLENNQLLFSEICDFCLLKNKLILANKIKFFNQNDFVKYLEEIEYLILKRYFVRRKRYSPMIYFQYMKIKYSNKFQSLSLNELKLFIKSITFFKNQ